MERVLGKQTSIHGALHPHRWGLLQIVNMGTLIATLDLGIVNVSMPVMARDYGVSLAQIQWVATIYLLTMIALLPFMGKWSDRQDRKMIYSYGFLIFAIGSLCIAVSSGYFVGLLVSRCLQGIGATMIMANSQAMVRQLFPNSERGRALGMNAIVIAAGTMGGPAIGGLLLEWIEWPWLFWINVPIALIAFLSGLRWFPQSERKPGPFSYDHLGSFLLAGSTCVLLMAAESSKKAGLNPFIIVEGILGVLLLAAFWMYERRIKYGILDKDVFGIRKIALGNAGSFIINFVQTATLLPIIFYLQGQLDLSPWSTGLLVLLQPLMMGLVAPYAGWFRDKYGAYFPVTIGPLFAAVSMLFVVCSGQVSVIAIAFQLALFGIGTGLFHATNNAEIMSAAPDSKLSLTGSMLAMIRYLGQIAGIGAATLFVGTMGMDGEGVDTISVSMRILFVICFIFCLTAAQIGRSMPRKKYNS